MNLYDHNQITEIHDKLNKIKSGNIAIAIMGMPYKCPPAPFEAALLIDSMLRKSENRDSIQIHFYSPAPITLPAAGPEVSQKILDLIGRTPTLTELGIFSAMWNEHCSYKSSKIWLKTLLKKVNFTLLIFNN